MSDGGFLVKFDTQEAFRCYGVSFDYDQWQYIVNSKEIMPLPKGIKTITVEVEQE